MSRTTCKCSTPDPVQQADKQRYHIEFQFNPDGSFYWGLVKVVGEEKAA